MNTLLRATTDAPHSRPGPHRGYDAAAPLPLLVICREDASVRLLRPLHADPGIELFICRQLTTGWVSFAKRVAAGVMIHSTRDQLAALFYARSAGIKGNLMLTLDQHHECERAELDALGDVTCVSVPITAESRDRVMSVLMARSSPATVDPGLRLLLDPIGRVVRFHGASVRLTQREFALLHCLSQHTGTVVRTREILHYVWDNASKLRSSQIVDVYICQLRRKLRRIGLKNAIRTVRGLGYALDCERAANP